MKKIRRRRRRRCHIKRSSWYWRVLWPSLPLTEDVMESLTKHIAVNMVQSPNASHGVMGLEQEPTNIVKVVKMVEEDAAINSNNGNTEIPTTVNHNNKEIINADPNIYVPWLMMKTN